MTLQERSRLGAAAVAAKAAQRAETLRLLLEQGEGFKRAAHKSGMAIRTARRWRQRLELR